MSTNPYQPPQFEASDGDTLSEQRATAVRNVRAALVILLAPAIYNFICFNFPTFVNPTGLSIPVAYRIVNSVIAVSTVWAIWSFGLAALEFITVQIHSIFARRSQRDEWKTILYLILRRAPVFALLGAELWAVWVAAIYQLGIGFYAVSVPIGVAAHLLAAGLYVPLIYRWYKSERSAAGSTP